MSKCIILERHSEIEDYRDTIRGSAEKTQMRLAELACDAAPLEFLYRLKFDAVGCDPLDSSRELNFVEQLNQCFTYLATFNAAELLFSNHSRIRTLTLNLGTKSGWDIESEDDGSLVAEVFAAVTPRNNGKLAKGIEKVSGARARHRYVFFMCPGCPPGPFKAAPKGVCVWSLGETL